MTGSPLSIPGLLACLFMPAVNAIDAVQETRFVGSLAEPAGDDQIVLRDFEVLLLQGSTNFFSVLDSEKDGCPWPESFGNLDATNGPSPHLVYRYDDSIYALPLPVLLLNLPESPGVGASWTQGRWSFEIVDKVESNTQQLWQIRGQERRGRRLQMVADSTGLVQSAQMDVFMGQGDKFELRIDQSSKTENDSAVSARIEKTIASLTTLQTSLARRPDSQLTELSSRQTEIASGMIDALTQQAQETSLQETVLRIRRDIARQERRINTAMERKQKLINSDAPQFSLNLIPGGTLESSTLKGKSIVLHFWAYSDKPLSEPYGQVGYLEFLSNKRKQDNVAVVGIAMNPRLQQAGQARTAKRSVRKLTEFMNLSYPIGFDDGSLIREFGDPRESGGKLPLWVVVSAEGKVVHYQAGFYEIDQRAGLKELADVLDQLK